MKLLLDECVNAKLRPLILGHDVTTVRHMGWLSKKDNDLLQTAAANGFEAMITLDRALHGQVNLNNLPLAVILLRTPRNRLDYLQTFLPQLQSALNHLKPTTFTFLDFQRD